MNRNRKLLTAISSAVACAVLGGVLTSCSSSSSNSTKTIAITASGGTPQTNVVVGKTFATLQAKVTSNGAPASGVSVTFTAPSQGARCVFTDGTTETDTTNSNGVATSSACTANDAAGAFTVTASTSGASSNASFSLASVAAAAATLTPSSGGEQTAGTNTAFANPLVANVVDQFGNPVSSVPVTFTAPSSGASCTPSSTSPVNTDSEGNASITCTANGTTGAYNVVAFSGSLAAVNFSETNANIVVTSAIYVFYVSGQEQINSGPNYYAIAGALTIDSLGDVLGGEEDYSDGAGITSPGEPNTPDTIAAANGALVVDPATGIGTLTITSSYKSTGVNGVQTFAVQFVNGKHALITQLDGTATSSGSLDLQTATNLSGNSSFAFAMAGVDSSSYASWDFGGVFAVGSGGATGTVDLNDAGAATPITTGTPFTLTAGATDSFGRTVVTGMTSPAVTLACYLVTPEAMRLIDVDTAGVAVGSAFGQGSNSYSNASLAGGVFAMIGQWSARYATVGEFATDSSGTITSGIADDNELNSGFEQVGGSIANSTYSITSGGYGSIAISGDGNVSALGLYMVDPATNINDPNNKTTDLGGALIIDLSSAGATPGGMGVITPQTDTGAASFAGNYAAGFQNINQFNSACGVCEFDMVGPFSMTAGALGTATIGADDSDPFGTLTGTPVESKGDSYSSTPAAISAGYYQMLNASSNPLNFTVNGTIGSFEADIFQASGTMLYWLDPDQSAIGVVFVGPIEQQRSLSGMPAAKKPVAKIQPKKQTTKAVRPFRTLR